MMAMDARRINEELQVLLAYNIQTERLVDENNRRMGNPFLFFKWRKVSKEIDFRLKYGNARLEELQAQRDL